MYEVGYFKCFKFQMFTHSTLKLSGKKICEGKMPWVTVFLNSNIKEHFNLESWLLNDTISFVTEFEIV